MFQWDKSIKSIEVEAGKVLHLFKSMREVQLALPGVSAQEASAYLCQYVHDDGVATVAAFHLHKSKVLAFYSKDPLVAPLSKTDAMLDDGLNFVESMGFLMTDQDLHLLDAADQAMLWDSLPLKAGIPVADEQPPKEKPAAVSAGAFQASSVDAKPKEKPKEKSDKVVSAAKPEVKVSPEKAAKPKAAAEPVEDVAENVNDLLAAVEAMRAKRPGLRARKIPSAEEINRRKQELRENIGRILASQ